MAKSRFEIPREPTQMAIAAIVGDFGYVCEIMTAQQVKARAIKPDIPKVMHRRNSDVLAERGL